MIKNKKELNKNLNSQLELLDPNFITGLIDAEGSFILKITELRQQLEFTLVLNIIDKDLVKLVYDYFGVGNYRIKVNIAIFSIVRLDLIKNNVIPHFDKYPLLTKKRADYELFKEAALIKINRKKNYDIRELISIKASMNWGLKGKLLLKYPDIVPVNRPNYSHEVLEINPYWLAGFVTGDGCFSIIYNGQSNSIGLRFTITQHIRDEELLLRIIDYLGCGKLYRNRNTFNLEVLKKEDIMNIIIPLFSKYSIKGTKIIDFNYFVESSLINLKSNPHLKSRLLTIKSSMNSFKYN